MGIDDASGLACQVQFKFRPVGSIYLAGWEWGGRMGVMALLRYFDDRGLFQTVAIGHEKFLVGRSESCQICISDDLASREHARFDRDPDGRFRVRDLGSRNKTVVNGQVISETLLTDGDMVRIGGRLFEYLDDSFRQDAPDPSFMTPDRVDPAGTEWVKTRQPVTLPLERVEMLATLGSDVAYPARAEDVAAAALGRLLLSMQADRGFVALRGESKKELRIVAHRGLTPATGVALTPVSRTFVYSSFLQSVAGRYPEQGGAIEGKSGFAGSGLVAPLLHGREVVGVVYVDRVAGPAFGAGGLDEIAASGAHLGALMAEAALQLAQKPNGGGGGSSGVSATWLQTLRKLQLAMTVAPESSSSFDLVVKLLGGRGRCGDFCDVIHAGDQCVYVLMVDGGGHGVAGLIQANGIRSAIRTALTVEGGTRDLGAIMSAVNSTMASRQGRQMVTCALLCMDLSEGHVAYINAGGPAPLLLAGAGRLVTLDQPSLVLGIDDQYGYEVSKMDLPSEFRLICHTDGLVEVANAAGEAFGSQNLHDMLLEKDAFGSSSDILQRIVGVFERHRAEHPNDDDACIVVVGHGS